jgi:hypothetical protein
MRQIITVVMLAVAPFTATAEPYEATRTFRSTLLGFSFEYPADWQKHRVAGCGSGMIGRTKEELDRLNHSIVRLSSPPPRDGGSPSLYVSHQKILDQSFDDYATPFRTPENLVDGDTAELLTYTVSDFDSKRGGSALSVIALAGRTAEIQYATSTYHFVKNRSLLVLQCSCDRADFAKWEPVFDKIARSVDMFPRYVESPSKGVKTLSVDGASFEYPGTWSRVIRSTDDDKDDPTVMEPEGLNKHRLQISLSFEDKTTQQFAQEAKRHASAKIVPFVSRDGKEGITVKMNFDAMGHAGALNETRWHVVPCRDGRLAVLFCWGRGDDPDDAKKPFRHAANTFTCK